MGAQMATRRRPKPWVFAIGFALAVFAAVSVLPVWTAYYIGGWEVTGKQATFWGMLWSIPDAAKVDFGRDFWIRCFGPQFVGMLSVLGVSFWIGLGIAWLRGRHNPVSPEEGP